MEEINGKTLVTTDWHVGLKQNSKLRLGIVVKVVKTMIDYIKANDVKNLVFCGDLFHERVAVNVNSMNVALRCVQSLAKCCNVYLIVGNHDSHMKNSIDINSLNIFSDTPNVKVISNTMEVSLNGNKSLFVPWLGDISKYDKETFDMMFGHFELSRQYLIKSYIIEHSQNNVSQSLADELHKSSVVELGKSSVGDLVGDFVDVVKKNGVVFSGHIHGHKEFVSKGRNFVLIGDPYQQNLGEKDNLCGFYIIDSDNTYSFHQICNVPRHVELRMSEIVKDISMFNFSKIKGNIIHKIYDVEVDIPTDAKISQLINDWAPFEELLPDYDIQLNQTNSELSMQNDSIQLIKKSKMEYVRNYINNIDDKVLQEQNIERETLYKVIEDHYNKVIEEK